MNKKYVLNEYEVLIYPMYVVWETKHDRGSI